MARLPYLDRADVKPEHQDLLTRNINLYRALVHSPDGLRTFSALGHFIRHTSRLDPRLREQVFELMSRPPGTIVPQDRVDFTPYWKLPIPPSYFAE